MTVVVARELGLDSEIARCADLSERAVRTRLNRESGNKLLSNAFPEMRADDDAPGGPDDDDHSIDSVQATTVARALACNDCMNTLSLHLGLPRRTLTRSFKEIRGNTLVANAIAKLSSAPTAAGGTSSTSTGKHRPLARGTIIGGRWRVVASLGEGGFGAVYEATDTTRGDARPVVMKFPKDKERAEHLKKELDLAYDLRHPNICGYSDIGNDKQHGTFLVLEHGGVSLAEWIERQGAMSADAAIDIITQAAAGLDHAHAENVVHQDIKPANILIQNAKTARFGSNHGFWHLCAWTKDRARRWWAHDCCNGGIVGYTPAYAAPEQRMGMANRRSDQYGLGLVFCAMLEGEDPSDGYKVRDFRRLSPRQNAAIGRALKFDSNDRFPSCGAFAAELAQHESKDR